MRRSLVPYPSEPYQRLVRRVADAVVVVLIHDPQELRLEVRQ